MPTLRTVLWQAWQRLREFVFRAGQVIVPVVAILSFFNAVGVDGTFGKENTRDWFSRWSASQSRRSSIPSD